MAYRFGDNCRIDKTIREIHGEYYRHPKLFSKSKEIQDICKKTGLSKEEAENALRSLKNHYDSHVLSKSESSAIRGDSEESKKIDEWIEKRKSEEKIVRCPRCKSTSITYGGPKPSIGRAVVGGAIAGPAGATIGGLTGKKGYAVCLNCGKRWKI